jgi:acetoin utilization deacetylase AcuC-like enzyme
MAAADRRHLQPSIGYVFDPVFLEHDLAGHPESAGRLAAALTGVKRAGLLDVLRQIPSRAATEQELTLVHDPAYIAAVRRLAERGGGSLDPDTYANRFTFEAASVAAGSLLDLTLAVIRGELAGGLGLVRPPGHHAMPGHGMGFCIFGNVALAAMGALKTGGLQRVAVVDFDVHHGNGTEAMLDPEPDALFVSTHQYPLFPGTGQLDRTGREAAEGATVNLPLPARTGDGGFERIFDQVVLPCLRRFGPELVLVSAGFDAHWRDPIGGLALSLTGQARLARSLADLAGEICGGKIVFALEGGYDLEVLEVGVANCGRVLLGRDDLADPLGRSGGSEPDLTDLIAAVKAIHRLPDAR